MSLFKKPVSILLPESATDAWKEMYGPSSKTEKAKSLYEAFSGDDEDDDDDDDDDEGDDEEPDMFPDEYPDENP